MSPLAGLAAMPSGYRTPSGSCANWSGSNQKIGLPAAIAVLVLMLAAAGCAQGADPLKVGSKRFTESYILGEVIRQTAQAAGETTATHSQGLGNTAIVVNALTSGSIDLYAEYTG